jgi:hypothetical protein
LSSAGANFTPVSSAFGRRTPSSDEFSGSGKLPQKTKGRSVFGKSAKSGKRFPNMNAPKALMIMMGLSPSRKKHGGKERVDMKTARQQFISGNYN